jgi:hypothetical protein
VNCVFAGKDCAGRLEWHHAIKQQRLRREFKYGARRDSIYHRPNGLWVPAHRVAPVTQTLYGQRTLDDILGDTRNRIFLCSHHHELVTNGRLKVEIPESVYEFAREFGLEAQLENDLRRAA